MPEQARIGSGVDFFSINFRFSRLHAVVNVLAFRLSTLSRSQLSTDRTSSARPALRDVCTEGTLEAENRRVRPRSQVWPSALTWSPGLPGIRGCVRPGPGDQVAASLSTPPTPKSRARVLVKLQPIWGDCELIYARAAAVGRESQCASPKTDQKQQCIAYKFSKIFLGAWDQIVSSYRPNSGGDGLRHPFERRTTQVCTPFTQL